MFEIQTEADAVLKVLSDVEDRAKDWTPALNEAALYMEGQTKENIKKQQDFEGNPLAPLAKSTLAAKSKRSAPSVLLRDSGALVSSIRARPASGNQSSVDVDQKYAKWLINGTKPYTIRPKQKRVLAFEGSSGPVFAKQVNHPGLPERRFLGFSQRNIEHVETILKRYLENG